MRCTCLHDYFSAAAETSEQACRRAISRRNDLSGDAARFSTTQSRGERDGRTDGGRRKRGREFVPHFGAPIKTSSNRRPQLYFSVAGDT